MQKDENLVKSITFDHINDDIERSLRELMESNNNIDAIYALNNHIAVAILKAIKKKEFKKFADVEIACFDDIELFNITDKKVVSVSQPIEDIGKNSSSLLLDIISGRQLNKSNIVLATQLIVR